MRRRGRNMKELATGVSVFRFKASSKVVKLIYLHDSKPEDGRLLAPARIVAFPVGARRQIDSLVVVERRHDAVVRRPGHSAL